MERAATMAVITLFDMQFQPQFARAGLDATSAAARDTRAFDGSTGVRVIVGERPRSRDRRRAVADRVARRGIPGLASRRRPADRNHRDAGPARPRPRTSASRWTFDHDNAPTCTAL